jgi:hypothetical protein
VAIDSLIPPVPDAEGHAAPPLAAHVQDWLAMPAGRGSPRRVFGAATEPLLVTVTTKLTAPFGTTDVVVVLFWTDTIAPAGKAALLLHGGVDASEQIPPAGGDAVAVFVTIAGGAALTAALIWYCTLPPAGKTAIASLIAPLPDAFGQAAPPASVQVHEKEVRPAGIESAMAVPGAATAPLFVTVTVNATVPPGMATVDDVDLEIPTVNGASASESLPPAGGVGLLAEAPAVFPRGSSVIAGAKATGSVYTRLCPAPVAREAPVAVNELPPGAPLIAPHMAVPAGVQPGAAVSVTPPGSASVMSRFIAAARPLFVTVMVYVPVDPGV